MSKDITTSGPSRRSIAKGAAWAVPAVSVAAAAPSLAASACDPVTVTPNCPGLLSGDSLTFTISNPDAGCVIPAGTPVEVTVSNLVGLTADLLVDINVGVLSTDSGTLALASDLAAGDSITVNVFPPSLLNLGVIGTATVSITGVPGSADYIIATAAGLTVALCS